ncbi:MAG TPA: hypothetical protein VF897_23260, partial [Roseiflexaceae bacterium]
DAVLTLANGVRDTSAFAPRLLQPYADAVERAAASVPGAVPETVLEAARRWRTAIDARDGTMDWEAAQTLAQAVAEHGGVNRCPDCGRFASPHIGHLCTAQNHTMGGAAMGLAPVLLRTTPGLRGLARGEHQITNVGETQDAEREALRRAWREVRGAFERREPVPPRLLIAGEYATRQPELDPHGAAMFARALLGEPEPPLDGEAMVAVRFMNRQRRAALRERNERPGLSHLDSAALALAEAEGVPSTVREAARAHLGASGDDTEATGRTLAHHLANLADLYDGDRADNRPAWTLDLPEVGNVAGRALHDYYGVILVANGGVSPGRETDQAITAWAQAVYDARQSGGTVPPLVMDAIDDLQSSDTTMYRRASVDIARYMAQAASAGQCVDCGRFVSPHVGHICPAQTRTASGLALDLATVTLTRLPVLREVATGPRTADTLEAQNTLQLAADAIVAAANEGQDVPARLYDAAVRLQNRQDGTTRQALAQAIVAVAETPVMAGPPAAEPEGATTNAEATATPMPRPRPIALAARTINRMPRLLQVASGQRGIDQVERIALTTLARGMARDVALADMTPELGRAAQEYVRCLNRRRDDVRRVAAENGFVRAIRDTAVPTPQALCELALTRAGDQATVVAIANGNAATADEAIIDQRLHNAAVLLAIDTRLPESAREAANRFIRRSSRGTGTTEAVAFAQALLEGVGTGRCLSCQQFIAQGGGHTCPSRPEQPAAAPVASPIGTSIMGATAYDDGRFVGTEYRRRSG